MTRSTRTTIGGPADCALALAIFAVASLAVTSACATTPAGPPPFDPIGSYTYTAYMDGQPIPGTMNITEGETGYEGSIRNDMFPPISITSVVVDGQAGTIEAVGPGGPVIIEFLATEGSIEGTWVMGEQGGNFTATKMN